ncbi:MAG TPA: hypothetical protein VE467_11965 [Chryseolinea sp.]|nr:hypothetical protein [Chryseolinea sp.]
MIELLPQKNETLIVAHDWDVVLERLSEVTADQLNYEGKPPKKLAGWIKDDRFQLLIRQRRPNSFAPVVEGKIDPTSAGCLIYLQYRLMPMTRMYLVLWTILAFISGIFLAIYYGNFMVGLASIGTIALIHGIAWGNFNIHWKPLHDVIFKVLA